MGALSKLEAYGIGLIVVALAAAAFGFYEHHQGYVAGKAEVQAEFDKFKNQVTQAGLKAEQDKISKEKADAEKISLAVSGRDAALAGLRAAQAQRNTGRGSVPITPAAAQGSRDQCFEPQALSAAVEQYRGRVFGLVTQGDEAAIDASALIRAWPK